MWRLVLFLTGFGFAVAGGTVSITYLNLIPAGLTWWEYLTLLRTRVECYLFPVGIIMITLATIITKD